MLERIQKALQVLSRRQDLVIVTFILMVIALMILPLPTWLMDVAIALNITIALLFILLAVYLKTPLEFSTLPSAILIATLIRIAITIATSRLILLQADAGEIIKSFGNFVIAGNLVVGLVIFAIIAIAQFVVITRGAERVAEVAARFALDALPGKQMSIDSDLRAGDIDRHEARRRRQLLEHESQYYGAMDGAMKFVKGDAIVSLIIIFVNLIGGILVGTLMRDMDVSTAFATYALLTVGDGLASQIPALLVAVAGGIVVTRVTTETSDNLGADLARELVSSAQSLAIVAAALLALSLVPGFPTLTFVVIGLAAAAGAAFIWWTERTRLRDAAAHAQAEADNKAAADAQAATPRVNEAQPGDVFAIRIAPDVDAAIDRAAYADTMSAQLAVASRRLGVEIPEPGYVVDPGLDSAMGFAVDGAEAWRGDIPAQSVFVPSRGVGDDAADAPTPDEATTDDERDVISWPGLGDGRWRAETDVARGDPRDAFAATHAAAVAAAANAERWAFRSFGMQEADVWLNRHGSGRYAALVQQLRQVVPTTRVAEVLRHLLAEDVSVAQPRLVLEALLDLAPRIEDNTQVADHLRLALSRPISAQFAGSDRQIAAAVVELDLEEHLRGAMIETVTGTRLSLAYDEADALAAALEPWAAPFGGPLAGQRDGAGTPHVVITAFDVRRPLWQFAQSRNMRLAVLAYEEVAADHLIRPVGALNMRSISAPRMADHLTEVLNS